jgi:hypothetical protein
MAAVCSAHTRHGVASSPARLLGCVRSAVWESVMLILSELVWDRPCSVAVGKQGHQQHAAPAAQHIASGDLAHIQGWSWGGLVTLMNIPPFQSVQNRAVPA